MGECCLSGKIHSGKPTGREEQHGGIDTYVAEPSGGSKAKSIIILSDSQCSDASARTYNLLISPPVFGWKLPNTRLLADEYARRGFYVFLPDLHEGDSVAEEILEDVEPRLSIREKQSAVDKTAATAKVGVTLGPWLVKHREAVAKPVIDGFINTIKMTPGVNKIGALGFCWGGRYAILSAHGQVDAAVAFRKCMIALSHDVWLYTESDRVLLMFLCRPQLGRCAG